MSDKGKFSLRVKLRMRNKSLVYVAQVGMT